MHPNTLVKKTHPREHASGVLVLVGDSIHNALDGVLIAAAFLNDYLAGLRHDLCGGRPRGSRIVVGDFALLVHVGILAAAVPWFLNLATGLLRLGARGTRGLALQRAMGH